jgi:putative transcriptional regulator
LRGGRLGPAEQPRVDDAKLDSPAAFEPDDDVPLLTMRELKQFKRVNPPKPAGAAKRPGTTKRKRPHAAAVRKSLRLSQAAFAALFGLSVATVRDWESGRRAPRGPARVLLQVIAREPDAVRRALA